MSNLRRHATLNNLLQDDLESPDDSHDDLGLPNQPPNIADPRIFMLSETILTTIRTSFAGLETTLKDISKNMEKIASGPSSFHALRADDRVSTRTPTSVSAHHHHACPADGSP